MAITLKIGTPVVGSDFFGRKNELALAQKRLMGNNLMLAAPRRVGKTSFARMIMSQMGDMGWNSVFIDLEGLSDVGGFFNAIHKALLELPNVGKSQQVFNYIKNHIPNINLSANIAGVETKVQLSKQVTDGFEIIQSNLQKLEEPTLIILDEMTVFLDRLLDDDGERLVKDFLDKFRSLRQNSLAQCKWLVASSIGVRHFASTHRLSDTINDFMDFPLGAYNDEEAVGLVKALAASEGLGIDEDCIHYLLSKIGWNIPYFIQLMISYLPGKQITHSDIDDAYDTVLNTSAFETWSERLTKEYGETEKYARRILDLLCLRPAGRMRDEIEYYIDIEGWDMEHFSTLLMTLEKDGYIGKDGSRRYFRSPLLRDYWKKKFCE